MVVDVLCCRLKTSTVLNVGSNEHRNVYVDFDRYMKALRNWGNPITNQKPFELVVSKENEIGGCRFDETQ